MRTTIILIIVLIALTAQDAYTLPRFALSAGISCASCHANPTGGQLRTDFGTAFAFERLALQGTADTDAIFNPRINDAILIGGDYRTQYLYDNRSGKGTFQAMTASVYGLLRLSSRLSVYIRQDVINGTYGSPYGGTEVYGLFRIITGSLYIKGGDFLPEYGWKLDDHSVYTRGGDLGYVSGTQQPVRTGLIFLPNYKDIGVEAGGTAGPLSITAGVFNGTGNVQPLDPSTKKAYVIKTEYAGTLPELNVRLGISGYGYDTYRMGGITAGAGTADSLVVVFGEMDWTRGILDGGATDATRDASAGFAELDIRLVQGLWLTGRYETFDPASGIADSDVDPSLNAVRRIVGGIQLFPVPFAEIRPEIRYQTAHGRSSSVVALTQIHLFF